MTDAFWTAFFANLPATIAATAALVVAYRTRRNVAGLKHHINSRMDELLERTRVESHAAGRREGIEAEQERQK